MKKSIKLLIFFLFVLVLSIIVYAALTTNNIHYYTFDTGDNADDQIGSADGSVTGATLYSTGVVNEAYFFDAVGDYIDMPNDFQYDFAGTSFSIWLNANSSMAANKQAMYFLKDGDEYFRIVYDYNGARMWFDITNTGFVRSTISGTEFDTWYHIVAVSDTANTYIYVNGVLNVTNTNELPDLSSATDFCIGANNDCSANNWHGKIDEVSFWNRELTEAEIIELYNSGSGLQYPYSAPSDSCTYSGTGDWIITNNCNITEDVKLETGKELRVASGNEVKVASGVNIT